MIRKLKKHRFVLYIVIVILSLLLTISFLVHSQCLKWSISSYRVLEDQLSKLENLEHKRTKYILLYTNFFKVENWKLKAETVGKDYFKSIQCPETDCVLTNNKNLLMHVIEYDAVVFHVAEPWAYSLFEKVPKHRSPAQIYVAASMESPAHTKHMLERDEQFFNWTMTYRLDSDIVWNYNNVVDINTGIVVAPKDHPQWRTRESINYYNDTLLKLASKKSRMAVQFISHCGAFSHRDGLVREIQQLMSVDVYGKCGTLKCPRESPRCKQMLTDEYQFYFAFENSLCRDYITEKLYNAMDSFIVPVVFGGANYSKFVPPGSYIDVQNFGSVRKLVDYLLYLVNNPEEYIQFFWWKEHYRITGSQPFCDLCRKLHDISTQERVQYYKDIKAWWYDDACQRKAKIQF